MAFLKQVLVTVLVLVVAFAGTTMLFPSVGRAVLQAGFPLPSPVRSAIVWISPEAGEPAPEVVGPTRDAGGRGATIVVTGPVTTGKTRTQMKAIGSGEAVRSVVVYPDNTSGIIQTVAVESGDEVEADELLVQLENANEELALDRARIALDAADDKLERSQRLNRSNALSQVGVTDALRERDNARLDLKAAEIALDKKQIRAPFAGRVGIVAVDRGDLVTTQTVIATVDDRRELKVVFYTPESFISELSLGADIEAVATARPGRSYEGKITAIDSRLDEASRTLRTEALVDNAADDLRPGMSFDVSMALPGDEFMAVDPLSVVWERTGPIVWKIVDGKAEKAKVRIIERTIDRMLIASDELDTGDQVVVEGLQSVREGGPVEVQPSAPPAPSQDEPAADEDEPVASVPGSEGAPAPDPASDARAEAAQHGGGAAPGFGVTRAEAAVLPRASQAGGAETTRP